MTGDHHLLELHDLKTYLHTSRGVIHAVDGVNLMIRRGEKIGLVGESGCGKSMTARSIMRLVPSPPGRFEAGEILYEGQNVLSLTDGGMRGIRGSEIAMVFQDPMSYLNPTMRIGDQIAEGISQHFGNESISGKVVETLEMVGLPTEGGFEKRYPHELSGGMRQRVLIAIALACRPKLLIADEPTTALDVTIQAQILHLLNELVDNLEMSLLLITHDLGIVAELCDRIYVMYAGQIVEEADAETLFQAPAHPYSQGLLEGVMSIDEFKPELHTIGGVVPDLTAVPSGCRFRPRCRSAMRICEGDPPTLWNNESHMARCWLYFDESEPREDGWREVNL